MSADDAIIIYTCILTYQVKKETANHNIAWIRVRAGLLKIQGLRRQYQGKSCGVIIRKLMAR